MRKIADTVIDAEQRHALTSERHANAPKIRQPGPFHSRAFGYGQRLLLTGGIRERNPRGDPIRPSDAPPDYGAGRLDRPWRRGD